MLVRTVAPGDVVPATDPGGDSASFKLNDQSVHPRFCVNGAALKFFPEVASSEPAADGAATAEQ